MLRNVPGEPVSPGCRLSGPLHQDEASGPRKGVPLKRRAFTNPVGNAGRMRSGREGERLFRKGKRSLCDEAGQGGSPFQTERSCCGYAPCTSEGSGGTAQELGRELFLKGEGKIPRGSHPFGPKSARNVPSSDNFFGVLKKAFSRSARRTGPKTAFCGAKA